MTALRGKAPAAQPRQYDIPVFHQRRGDHGPRHVLGRVRRLGHIALKRQVIEGYENYQMRLHQPCQVFHHQFSIGRVDKIGKHHNQRTAAERAAKL